MTEQEQNQGAGEPEASTPAYGMPPLPAYGTEPYPSMPAPEPFPPPVTGFPGPGYPPPVAPYPPVAQGYPGMPPMPGMMPMGYAPVPKTNGLAIASLVCSLLGLATCAATSILGVIFGHLAKSQIKQSGEEGEGMALAGLIVGYIGLALFALIAIFYFGLIALIVGSSGTTTY
ncbi:MULTISPECIES: DUF4190 domain-containing protein [Mycobacteriaceae]|jgi:hypothetical protein|uniref:DUF4190 domain-containing protein n=2 Tax=Mycolicibacterium mucogenicum TaxID=56689 RepID=A0A1A0M5T5_MYCMU|nr:MULTISPECIES: DUF4190 domain-containing protein [Mycolicibacterium]MCX8556434.1 DUF4190 domain-containing protein [Mycolicibacterium mucogenicum]OBA80829.1 hypothetical protein A5642_28850 [Mycolicibacterium mucogenicum]BCI83524.1 hypothetical protein MTY66_51490 [Mycolicibacterium sp. TY66]BCJ78832.1 hypothetical protein MTY81_02050 [Mycolicibacterium sp. TY81]GCA97458.1 hypothetical protein NCCNTM_10930 [Mycolicibacterium sp. NCC-Tsukiji]